MVIQKEVEGTYFDSAFQTGSASLMTLNQYIGKVKSGAVSYTHLIIFAK